MVLPDKELKMNHPAFKQLAWIKKGEKKEKSPSIIPGLKRLVEAVKKKAA
jgi:hypothetical protein